MIFDPKVPRTSTGTGTMTDEEKRPEDGKSPSRNDLPEQDVKVEAAGVEPASARRSDRASTCVERC